jgi:hypothetical protein
MLIAGVSSTGDQGVHSASDSTSGASATLFEAIDVLEKEADVRGQVEWQIYEAVCPSRKYASVSCPPLKAR